MFWSVAETFERVRKHLPTAIPSAAVDRCAHVAAHVPKETCSHYLEFHLSAGGRLDFLSTSTDKRIARSLNARLAPTSSRAWRTNLSVLRDWADPDSEISRAPFVWLEYDTGPGFVEAEPEASLVVGLERGYTRRHEEGMRPMDPESVTLGMASFRRLLPEHAREKCLATLERCYEALPPLGAIPYAPVMTAREPVTAKPFVILPRALVFNFLERIGWPGSLDAVEQLLKTYYASFQASIYLDVTVTDRVEERLGIATSQFQRKEVDFSSLDWWRVPKELQDFKSALRHWAGYSEERLGGERVWIHRWLDTKAVLNQGKVEYKSYLGFSPTRPPLFC